MAQTPRFSCFGNLPYDIRHQIYALATPPRVVTIREVFVVGDDYYKVDHDWSDKSDFAFGEFEKQLFDGPLTFNLKLHPEIADFAFIWRHQMPWPTRRLKQTKLEAYGFTSNRAPYQPWEVTPETPEIPIDWLMNFPELAFELTRDSYFCSDTPIPVFLHVCTESREALRSWGYELAFSCRNHGPKTWFHFGRDRLYIPKITRDPEYVRDPELWPPMINSEVSPGEILSGCRWDIGQFAVRDLCRVKRLVLGRTLTHSLSALEVMENILRVCPNLEEISFENWSAIDIIVWYLRDDRSKGRPLTASEHSMLEASLEAETYDCIALEDVDFVGNVCWSAQWDEEDLPPLSPLPDEPGARFWEKKKELGWASYADFLSKDMQTKLARHLGHSNHSLAGRKLPTIRQVHLCPETLVPDFLKGRHDFWKYYDRLRQGQSQGIDILHSIVNVPNPDLPFSFNWTRIRRWGEPRVWDYEGGVRRAGGQIDERVRVETSWKWYFDRIKIGEPVMDII